MTDDKATFDPDRASQLIAEARSSRFSLEIRDHLADQLEAAMGVIAEQRRSLLARPERIVAAPADVKATDWVIKDIQVHSVFVPPPTDEDRRRDKESAQRHDPLIARTLIGGPGNRQSIRACACRVLEVVDAESWAAHVGVPGAGPFLETICALEDAAMDAVHYPEPRTLETLGRAIKRVRIVAPTTKEKEDL